MQINIVCNERNEWIDDVGINFIAVLPLSSDRLSTDPAIIPIVACKALTPALKIELASVSRAAKTGISNLLACLPELSQHCGLLGVQCKKLAAAVKQVASLVIDSLSDQFEPHSRKGLQAPIQKSIQIPQGQGTPIDFRVKGNEQDARCQAENDVLSDKEHRTGGAPTLWEAREACSKAEHSGCSMRSVADREVANQASTWPTNFSKGTKNLGADLVPFSYNSQTFVPLKLELSGRTATVKSSIQLQPLTQNMLAGNQNREGLAAQPASKIAAVGLHSKMDTKPGSAPAWHRRSKRCFCIDGKWCELQVFAEVYSALTLSRIPLQ